MNKYMQVFIDEEYPTFIDNYLNVDSLQRLKHITQFCGCDYSNLYNPKFVYTRYAHSLVVAHMTWHFTHDKKETLAALLHDIGTPAFSHTIDYVLGDYINQESSEIKLSEIIKKDKKLIELLKKDKIGIYDFDDLKEFHILENNKPSLCTDRLDGVLGTCYIWIHRNNLQEIKEVYDDLTVLTNEDGINEIGFKTVKIAEKFSQMVYYYAMEVQSPKDKYIMQYISDLIKISVEKGLFQIDYLYNCKEIELINIFTKQFQSFKSFCNLKNLIVSDVKPDFYYVSIESKKRNSIPLVLSKNKIIRINKISNYANNLYEKYEKYKMKKYIYTEEIKII